MSRFRLVTTLALLAPVVAVVRAPAEDPRAWLAGDFHVHTCYSHDGWCPAGDDNTGPDEFYTASGDVTERFAEAAARGLDFLTITDHNDIRAHSDPGFGAFGVTPVRAYEHSMGGHAQMLGATRLFSAGSGLAGAQAMADALRAEGGLFQINHPTSALVNPIDSCDETGNVDWDHGTALVPDSIEVWNIWHPWQPPAPASNSNDDAETFWECFLNEGHRVTATGGSDSHWLSTSAVQGPGNPTTWVLAENSEAGILSAVGAGRTAISMFPPHEGGLPLLLTADLDGDGSADAQQGDTVPAGTTVTVSNTSLPGFARIRTNQGLIHEAPIAPGVSVSVQLPPGTEWARATVVTAHPMLRAVCPIDNATTYCRNRLVVAAITSPVYVAG